MTLTLILTPTPTPTPTLTLTITPTLTLTPTLGLGELGLGEMGRHPNYVAMATALYTGINLLGISFWIHSTFCTYFK